MSDITIIREIMNNVRSNYSLPLLIAVGEAYAVVGLDKLFEMAQI